MIIASAAIYFSSANFRQEDFFNRLRSKARSTAKLLLDADNIDPGRVSELEKDNPVNLYNEKIIIINFLDDIIYSSDKEGEIKYSTNVIETVRLLQRVTFNQGSYQVIGTLYTAKFDRFVVIAAATDVAGHAFLLKLRIILLIVCIVSLFIFTVAGWLYSGRALKPISDMLKRVEDISITSLNLRVPVLHEKDEIGRLAMTFNNMLERLETSFGTQKVFISNASHELRTPLTSINGQLEVLLMKNRSAEEYREAVESILDDLRSLIELSNRLLLLARTNILNPLSQNKKIRIDEILWQAQEETMKFNKDFRINISINPSLTDSDQMLVDGDESLLKVAMSNIIDNACKYSPDKSVEINIRQSGKWIELLFTDKGIGIPESEIRKVFEPFYRSANALAYRGTGIGLQLVNQIIKSHKGEIKLSSKVGVGTEVVITLPVVA